MKKTLTSIILAAFIGCSTTPVPAADLNRIPEALRGYQHKAERVEDRMVYRGGIHFHTRSFFGADERTPYVVEMRQANPYAQNVYMIELNPMGYMFDLNLDGKISVDEILFDPEKDGLNGNEEWGVPEV